MNKNKKKWYMFSGKKRNKIKNNNLMNVRNLSLMKILWMHP